VLFLNKNNKLHRIYIHIAYSCGEYFIIFSIFAKYLE
ncbi:MAG: hypothetical protein ACI93S_001475, partial [Ancylomarina sp.]